jgi:hypothetical protein
LFTAALGAPKVDAQLVVETTGVPNLCEHVPAPLIWACLSEVGNRSLGRDVIDEQQPIMLHPKTITTPPPAGLGTPGKPLAGPPPEVITKPANPPLAPEPKVGPSIPTPVTPAGSGSQSLSDIVAELEAESSREERVTTPPPSRVRTPTSQRFRQSNTGTGIGRLAPANARRPQAQAMQPITDPRARRGQTEPEDVEAESVAKSEDWKSSLAVEDEQLVDWQASEETITNTEEVEGRKR